MRRFVLISLSVILTIAFILTSCGSPEQPVLGDSYDKVKKWITHFEDGWGNLGYIIYEKNKITYKHVLPADDRYKNQEDTVTEYLFKDDILYEEVWIMPDENGIILNHRLYGPLATVSNQSVFYRGKSMYYTINHRGETEYTYRDWSRHFNAMCVYRLTVRR